MAVLELKTVSMVVIKFLPQTQLILPVRNGQEPTQVMQRQGPCLEPCLQGHLSYSRRHNGVQVLLCRSVRIAAPWSLNGLA